MEPEHAGVVSSSSTLHFATEAEEATAEESPVFLEEKKEEQAIASIVVLEAFNVAKSITFKWKSPKVYVFLLMFVSCFKYYFSACVISMDF